MKQLSAMPDEKPDKDIKATRQYKSLKTKCIALLSKLPAYEYCKMAMVLKDMPDSYTQKVYGMTTSEAFAIMNGVFAESVAFQDTVQSFLKNTATIPNYGIKKPETDLPPV